MTSQITILDDYDAHKMYDEMLNECYPMVNICGYDHYPAECLKEMDPVAYRCGFLDWTNFEMQNYILVEGCYNEYDLKKMQEELNENEGGEE